MESKIKNLIKTTSVPLLIKNSLHWELLEWDLQKWKEILGNESLQFRRGYNSHTKDPQFENSTAVMKFSFEEFLTYIEEHNNEWLYFDYKYLKNWLTNIPKLRENVLWEAFGFSECNVDDSTFWLGSKGAHTPCHQDTYGCNIVAQVYGRKRWLLFPPNENLQPTRIPYEESSIYSKINMFGPDEDDFKGIIDCRSIILNPGDVLIVPHKWWHYVENLELSISINMWIDLPIDHEERVNESIVQMLISQLSGGLHPKHLSHVLNPESLDDVNLIDAFHLIQACIKNYNENTEKCSSMDVQKLLKEFSDIVVIASLKRDELNQFVKQQKQKLDNNGTEKIIDDEHKLIQNYFDAVLHTDVINVIKNKLLKRLLRLIFLN
ncbi:hypothetical protein RN001_000793 [Aquatica leii]|uniref:JmjC domain-containing protein n=1 Tax=Aquatica leii TaxID=1421715 RepID=A0AAN7SJB0_9COLE|nr:hypothetical protein RN001_000793 [Aquatica leii]